ncbi:hypothetical protein GF324_12340 [bacterium]|nr:hypothetical protein [bacterium]
MKIDYRLEADASNMKAMILGWPERFSVAWKVGREIGRTVPVEPPSALVWVGMGGSAVGGDFVAAMLRAHASFPVFVHRGGPLPAWVDDSCRVQLVSYSGNTAETLATAEEAVQRQCAVDVLTSGGTLEQWAKGHEIHPWIIEGGRPPRTALPDMLAFTLGVLHGRGWVEIADADLSEGLTLLQHAGDELAKAPGEGHAIEHLIEQALVRHMMIYGSGRFAPVARRWACQLNENAKRTAHWGELPEMNHNEVVPLREGSPWSRVTGILLLDDPFAPDDVRVRVEATASIASETGWGVEIVRPTADGPLAQLLELTLVGDWLSYWLALAQGIDPTPIPTIERLKSMI